VRRFLIVAFGVAWLLQLLVVFAPVPAVAVLPLLGLAGIAPTLAAIACEGWRGALAPLRGPWPLPWLALVLFGPVAIAGTAAALDHLLGGPSPGVAAPFVGALVLPPIGEEPGWRGALHRQLRASHGVRIAAVAGGTIWAAWHLPTACYPGATLTGFVPYAVAVAAAGVVLVWLVERTGSLPVAVIAHVGLNLGLVHGDGGLRVRWLVAGVFVVLAALALRSRTLRATASPSASSTCSAWP